jgi:hypothetical protein
MLQVLHLTVPKVDHMLLIGCTWEVGEGASGPRVGRCPSGAAPHMGARNADTSMRSPGSTGPCGRAKWGAETECNHRRPSECMGASSTVHLIGHVLVEVEGISLFSSNKTCSKAFVVLKKISRCLKVFS